MTTAALRRLRLALSLLVSASFLVVAACGSDDDEDDGPGVDGCEDLCEAGGFADGRVQTFTSNVVECQCTGAGRGVAKAACEGYCSEFSVRPENALLSTEVSPNDKCVCDGTGG